MEAAEIQKRQMQFLYATGDNVVLMDQQSFEQLEMPRANIDNADLMAEQCEVEVLLHDGRPISVDAAELRGARSRRDRPAGARRQAEGGEALDRRDGHRCRRSSRAATSCASTRASGPTSSAPSRPLGRAPEHRQRRPVGRALEADRDPVAGARAARDSPAASRAGMRTPSSRSTRSSVSGSRPSCSGSVARRARPCAKTRPSPLASRQPSSVEPQRAQRARTGKANAEHAAQRCSASTPRAAAVEVGRARSGAGAGESLIAASSRSRREHERRVVVEDAAVAPTPRSARAPRAGARRPLRAPAARPPRSASCPTCSTTRACRRRCSWAARRRARARRSRRTVRPRRACRSRSPRASSSTVKV